MVTLSGTRRGSANAALPITIGPAALVRAAAPTHVRVPSFAQDAFLRRDLRARARQVRQPARSRVRLLHAPEAQPGPLARRVRSLRDPGRPARQPLRDRRRRHGAGPPRSPPRGCRLYRMWARHQALRGHTGARGTHARARFLRDFSCAGAESNCRHGDFQSPA